MLIINSPTQTISATKREDTTPLKDVVYKDGRIVPVPAKEIEPHKHLLPLLGHELGVYCFPTTELIDWLRARIGDRSAIEIGAGNGSIGRALDIKMTDNKMQLWKEIREVYQATNQPIINYGPDVVTCDALEAVRRFKPQVVIGSWITHKYDPRNPKIEGNKWGVDEGKLIERVEEYIMIGNLNTHRLKPLFDYAKIYQFDWLYSRSVYPDKNCIMAWQ